MDRWESNEAIGSVAAEAFAALSERRQITPFSLRPPGLSIDGAYRVPPLMRQMYEAAGASVVGRKVGFTNRTIWDEYGVYAPIWGYVFDQSAQDLACIEALPLTAFSEPLIEPEIIFGLSASPTPHMDDRELSSCIEWIALGFEIVQSIYPGWKFSPADTIAANGMHGALLIGPRHAFAPCAAQWQRTLSAFEVELSCEGRLVDRGRAENVLGGPIAALRHLVNLLAGDPLNPPLQAGEIVCTGTLTKAMPVAPGQCWTAEPSGIALDAIRINFC